MKTLTAVLAVLFLGSLMAPALSAQDPGIHLVKVTWTLDPECPGTGADDRVVVVLRPIDLGPDPEWSVEIAQQVTPLSCPHWVKSWGVTGGRTPFALDLSTEVSKAVRVRARWDGGSRDWILSPPAGGDTCFDPPQAPICQE